jgi:hypothetical protein
MYQTITFYINTYTEYTTQEIMKSLSAMGSFASYTLEDIQNEELYARIAVVSDISALNYFQDLLENNTALAFSLENTRY